MRAGDGWTLDLADLRAENVARCEEAFHPLDEWTANDWATALAGEVGELCNLLKKRRRGEEIRDVEIGDEIADVLIYLDLLAARLGIDLARVTAAKFNAVSVKRGSSRRLPLWPRALPEGEK